MYALLKTLTDVMMAFTDHQPLSVHRVCRVLAMAVPAIQQLDVVLLACKFDKSL